MYTTKNRRRSVFWRVGLFKRISRNSANCLLCPQTIATPNSSTTGLKTHLMRRHSDYAHFLEHVKDDPNLWLDIAEQTIQKVAKQSEEEGEGEKEKQCHQIIKRERHNSTDDEEEQRPFKAKRARGEEAKERQRIHQKQQMKREQRDDSTEQQQQQMVNRDQQQQQKAFTALPFEQNQHQQGEQQQQHFVDRKGIRWEFLASAFIYREMIAIAAFHGFVRTTWNTKCKRWWFKCKFNTAHFKCSCRATWLSSRKALFTTGLHNHPVKMDSENGPFDTVDKHPPAQFEQKGNYWYLFADGIRSGNALSKFCSANGLVQDGKSPNDLRVYLRCRSVAMGCRFRALYMRQLGAVYRRSVGHRHSLNVGKREQQSESADSKCRPTYLSAVCSKNITTSSFTHTSAVISQIHPPPLLKSKSGIWWELSVVLPPSCSVNVAKLAHPLRYVNESVAGRVYYKCTNSKNCKKTGVFLRSIRALYTRGVHTCPSLANGLSSPNFQSNQMEKRTKPASLPSHSGRTLLSIDDDGNYVEIPIQREQSSSVKKTFVDIGRPEIALQKVTCGRGIQWDFVQMITDKAQLHFYIDHFSLSHNIRRDKSGRMHLHCLERNGAFKCPYRMMLIVKEKHALYATGVHNHSLKLTKRKPIKLDLKELNPTAEHQKRHFELHSFTEDVIKLAEEMGLDFRKERGHFVLILKSFAEGDKENQPSTSSSVQQNEEVVKLLVFVDKRSSIRCREYLRKTTYDNAGSSREEKLLEHDDRLMKGKKEHWQKWGRTQFLRAVRSKCKQFFFGKFDEEETSSS